MLGFGIVLCLVRLVLGFCLDRDGFVYVLFRLGVLGKVILVVLLVFSDRRKYFLV